MPLLLLAPPLGVAFGFTDVVLTQPWTIGRSYEQGTTDGWAWQRIWYFALKHCQDYDDYHRGYSAPPPWYNW